MTITNYPQEMPSDQAMAEAANVLEEEANQLAGLVDHKEAIDKLSHRHLIAIHREIKRLRLIATTLRKAIPA